MTNGYAKIFSTILASSIWSEDDRTRLVWITMLVMMDGDGQVRAAIPGLAHFARVPVDDCQRALDKFIAPDAASATKTNDGRRVEEIDGGWRILNHSKYRDMMSLEERQEYWRRKKRESREKYAKSTAGMTTKQLVRHQNKVMGALDDPQI